MSAPCQWTFVIMIASFHALVSLLWVLLNGVYWTIEVYEPLGSQNTEDLEPPWMQQSTCNVCKPTLSSTFETKASRPSIKMLWECYPTPSTVKTLSEKGVAIWIKAKCRDSQLACGANLFKNPITYFSRYFSLSQV